jgi:hypothetical protein
LNGKLDILRRVVSLLGSLVAAVPRVGRCRTATAPRRLLLIPRGAIGDLTVLLLTVASFYLFAAVPGNLVERGAALCNALSGATPQPIEVLPGSVRSAIGLLAAARADSYRCSAGVLQNGEMMQRLVEGAYPLRMSEKAPHLVRLDSEPSPAGCSEMSRRRGVALDLCR